MGDSRYVSCRFDKMDQVSNALLKTGTRRYESQQQNVDISRDLSYSRGRVQVSGDVRSKRRSRSGGVYWIPLYQILETRGFQVFLVNAQHVKNVPGRKSDVSDCQWIQYLHSVGSP